MNIFKFKSLKEFIVILKLIIKKKAIGKNGENYMETYFLFEQYQSNVIKERQKISTTKKSHIFNPGVCQTVSKIIFER